MVVPTTQSIAFERMNACETFWRARYEWLLECGYELPPQLKPDTPPVITSKTDWKSEDDYIASLQEWARNGSMDVLETATGNVLTLYQVLKKDCLRMLDAYPSWHIPPGAPTTFDGLPIGPHRNELRNRCRPIIAAPLQDKSDPQLVFLVTPTSRSHLLVEYATVGEAMQFFRQVLEGLQFLHERHIASGDEALFDVQMDMTTFLPTGTIVPSGFEPSSPGQALNVTVWHALSDGKQNLRRSENARYYFNIPRGLRRSAFSSKQASDTGLELGSGQPMEHEPDHTFRIKAALDIMHLGQMLHRDFIKRFEALSFLRHLVSRMMEDNLAEVIAMKSGVFEWQATIDEIVEKFGAIAMQLPEEMLEERLEDSDRSELAL